MVFHLKKGLQFTDGTFQACLGSSQVDRLEGQGIPKGDILGPRPFWLGEETKKPKNQRHWAQMNSVTSNYFWMIHIFWGESSTKNSTVKTSPGAKKSIRWFCSPQGGEKSKPKNLPKNYFGILWLSNYIGIPYLGRISSYQLLDLKSDCLEIPKKRNLQSCNRAGEEKNPCDRLRLMIIISRNRWYHII